MLGTIGSDISHFRPIKEDNDRLDLPKEDESKEQFINEFKEIADEKNRDDLENGKIIIEDESVRFLPENNEDSSITNKENNEEKIVDQNDVNDDLLQIPAFLRRQAN